MELDPISYPSHEDFNQLVAGTRMRYPTLTVTSQVNCDGHWASIRAAETMCSPLVSKAPVQNPQMLVHASHLDPTRITFKFQAHFIPLFSGLVTDALFETLLKSLLPESNYRLCPGLPSDLMDDMNFECKSARKWGFPFHRIDHHKCQLWIPVKLTPWLKQEPTCGYCKVLTRYIRERVKKHASLTPERKAKRSLPSSRCPIKYLAPASRTLRQSRSRKEKSIMKKKLDKYRRYDVAVGDATHEELLTLVSEIHRKSRGELEALLAEAEREGKGSILKQKWQQDLDEQVSFHKDQRKSSK